MQDAAPLPIRLRAVGKRFRDRQVLSGVEFDVGPGESVAIVGLNGAGKTTLLRCLLDFSRPDTGDISIFGVPSRDPRSRASLAYLPERFTPPSHLSGHEVLVWISGLHGRAWSRAQTDAAFDRFELPAAAIGRPVRDYSKGMAQRLGLAAVLMSQRPLLILDEPKSGLDPLARRFVDAALAQAREAGTALLFTTHTLPELDRQCDRMVIIDAGRVVFCGPPRQLLADDARAARAGVAPAGAAARSTDLESAFLARLERTTATLETTP